MKESEVITCGRENIREFNQLLKEKCPEMHTLAKQLHQAGMIDGLRGAKIQLNPKQPETVTQHTAHNASPTENGKCNDCSAFIADQIGDGMGLGQCTRQTGIRGYQWANTKACQLYSSKQ